MRPHRDPYYHAVGVKRGLSCVTPLSVCPGVRSSVRSEIIMPRP